MRNHFSSDLCTPCGTPPGFNGCGANDFSIIHGTSPMFLMEIISTRMNPCFVAEI